MWLLIEEDSSKCNSKCINKDTFVKHQPLCFKIRSLCLLLQLKKLATGYMAKCLWGCYRHNLFIGDGADT